MLNGLLKPCSGSLLISGIDILKDPAQVKRRIGFVPQELALYQSLTARENLSFFGSMEGLSGRRLKASVETCLALSGLGHLSERRVETFSGGMKRRLSLVIGLIHDPAILFLDEPTVGIDPQTRNFIYESLRTMNSSGVTIVYTSHHMDEIEHLCEEVAVMDHGRIICRGRTEELLRSYGYDVIKVHTLEAVSERLRRELGELAHLTAAEFDGRNITFKSAQPQQTMLDAVSLLRKNGVEVLSLSHGAENLEQLFLALTGERLRE